MKYIHFFSFESIAAFMIFISLLILRDHTAALAVFPELQVCIIVFGLLLSMYLIKDALNAAKRAYEVQLTVSFLAGLKSDMQMDKEKNE